MKVVFVLLLFQLVSSRRETWTASKSSSDASLSFLVLGDWGGQPQYPYTTEAEVELASVMADTATSINSQFTLALGDNFYDTGVRNVDDERFSETFEKVFTGASLQKPWYVVCGNHDHYGNCSAEIAYSAVSSRWTFPDYYYTKEFAIPGSNSTVAILFIDTVVLSGLTHPIERSRPPSGPSSLSAAIEQWSYINETLTKWSKSGGDNQWRLVVGHYPVWSVAEHGPTKDLVDKLKPMLERAGVTAYFCGHDHNMQHIADSGVQYYVVGAGHLIDPSMAHKDDVPRDSLKYYYDASDKDVTPSDGAFATVTATPTQFTVTYISHDGKKLYTSTLNRN